MGRVIGPDDHRLHPCRDWQVVLGCRECGQLTRQVGDPRTNNGGERLLEHAFVPIVRVAPVEKPGGGSARRMGWWKEEMA
jgi:hypothetical protein